MRERDDTDENAAMRLDHALRTEIMNAILAAGMLHRHADDPTQVRQYLASIDKAHRAIRVLLAVRTRLDGERP